MLLAERVHASAKHSRSKKMKTELPMKMSSPCAPFAGRFERIEDIQWSRRYMAGLDSKTQKVRLSKVDSKSQNFREWELTFEKLTFQKHELKTAIS